MCPRSPKRVEISMLWNPSRVRLFDLKLFATREEKSRLNSHALL